ncbi:hypothetical protein PHMEG_00013346 [Phytophthora megakarya]|uniref:Uncharacterized protein n=1 Tax=Phytophthora megakarya TaxID=4795 RepID=A0A225W928_9STRA|nr:hypothetical protein PHMEG_00013346 [Phytophthora megakarya]
MKPVLRLLTTALVALVVVLLSVDLVAGVWVETCVASRLLLQLVVTVVSELLFLAAAFVALVMALPLAAHAAPTDSKFTHYSCTISTISTELQPV